MTKPGPTPRPLAERFESKVDRSAGDGCHLWTGSVNNHGYGQIREGGTSRSAHRVAWELANGPVPEGRMVLHRCDNPPCVNVAHLFLGTQFDNMQDAAAKGRIRNWHTGRTVCIHGHPFDEANTYVYKGGRGCLTCRREQSLASYYRRKAARS